jgi:endonuclease/exonuclease/phosphatase family metal-dependent hydrolase
LLLFSISLKPKILLKMHCGILKNIILVILLPAIFLGGCRKTPGPPDPGSDADFSGCIAIGTSNSFEIVTLNLAGFPREGSLTVSIVKNLITSIDPDVIALQEVASESAFISLAEKLPGYTGVFYPELNDEWNLAYLVKSSEAEIDNSSARLILTGDSYAFPRAPFEIFVRHKSLGIEAYLINIHLKCCGGTENEDRRRDASLKLDNYIKTSRPQDPVIILGDFNDEITGSSNPENVFYNFIEAPSEYLFTDMEIARGSLLWWSYPSWPSHIDHILVTNELFDSVDTTIVLKPDPCLSEYFELVSDHRPVEVVLKR